MFGAAAGDVKARLFGIKSLELPAPAAYDKVRMR